MKFGFVILFQGQGGCESSPETSLMTIIAMLLFPMRRIHHSSSSAVFYLYICGFHCERQTFGWEQKLSGLLKHNEREENIKICSRKNRYAFKNKLKSKEINKNWVYFSKINTNSESVRKLAYHINRLSSASQLSRTDHIDNYMSSSGHPRLNYQILDWQKSHYLQSVFSISAY